MSKEEKEKEKEKRRKRKKVLRGFEPRLLDSKSRVFNHYTIEPPDIG
jgi:hypothetical protein